MLNEIEKNIFKLIIKIILFLLTTKDTFIIFVYCNLK